jgi:hypothetical protein
MIFTTSFLTIDSYNDARFLYRQNLLADTLNKIAFQNVVSLKMHQVKNTAIGKNILTVLDPEENALQPKTKCRLE